MPAAKVKHSSRKYPNFSIVGSGQFARVLAHALHDAGYKVAEIISRELADSRRRAAKLARSVSAQARSFSEALLNGEVIWICIPDDFIPQCAQALAATRGSWEGKLILHSSGALSSKELEPFRKSGAMVASAHPLMSFVATSSVTLTNVPFAVEGEDDALRRLRVILRRLGTAIFEIKKENKAAYHAFGSFSSPLLIAYLVQMEAAAELAGLGRAEARKRATTILQQTLKNYLRNGPEAAFSGPLKRGDVGTIQGHLRALQKDPKLAEFYGALVEVAVKSLPVQNAEQIRRLINAKGRPVNELTRSAQ